MAGFFSSPPVCGAGGRVYYPGASGGVLRGGHAEANPPDHEQHSLPELWVVERGSGIAGSNAAGCSPGFQETGGRG